MGGGVEFRVSVGRDDESLRVGGEMERVDELVGNVGAVDNRVVEGMVGTIRVLPIGFEVRYSTLVRAPTRCIHHSRHAC